MEQFLRGLGDFHSYRRMMKENELRIAVASRTSITKRYSPRPQMARAQRVLTKMHYTTPNKLKQHISYIRREGADKAKGRPELFGSTTQENLEREVKGEDRFYKIILSPENGDRLDMQKFTEDFIKTLENETYQSYEWGATIHDNTEHPHAHIVIRGIDRNGNTVDFSRDMVREGFRSIAQDLATRELGHRTDQEILEQRAREISQQRFTSIDRGIEKTYKDVGEFNEETGKFKTLFYSYTPTNKTQENRLNFLVKNGYATQEKGGEYHIDADWKKKLKDEGNKLDKCKLVYGDKKLQPGQGFSICDKDTNIEGTILSKGVADDHYDKPYALVQNKGSSRIYYVENTKLSQYNEKDQILIKNGKIVSNNIDKKQPSQYKGNSHEIREMLFTSIDKDIERSSSYKGVKKGNEILGYTVKPGNEVQTKRLEFLEKCNIATRNGNTYILNSNWQEQLGKKQNQNQEISARGFTSIDQDIKNNKSYKSVEGNGTIYRCIVEPENEIQAKRLEILKGKGLATHNNNVYQLTGDWQKKLEKETEQEKKQPSQKIKNTPITREEKLSTVERAMYEPMTRWELNITARVKEKANERNYNSLDYAIEYSEHVQKNLYGRPDAITTNVKSIEARLDKLTEWGLATREQDKEHKCYTLTPGWQTQLREGLAFNMDKTNTVKVNKDKNKEDSKKDQDRDR